jgi:hypothetical protein
MTVPGLRNAGQLKQGHNLDDGVLETVDELGEGVSQVLLIPVSQRSTVGGIAITGIEASDHSVAQVVGSNEDREQLPSILNTS